MVPLVAAVAQDPLEKGSGEGLKQSQGWKEGFKQGLERFDSRVGEHRTGGSTCCSGRTGRTGERARGGVKNRVKDGKRALLCRV